MNESGIFQESIVFVCEAFAAVSVGMPKGLESLGRHSRTDKKIVEPLDAFFRGAVSRRFGFEIVIKGVKSSRELLNGIGF